MQVVVVETGGRPVVVGGDVAWGVGRRADVGVRSVGRWKATGARTA